MDISIANNLEFLPSTSIIFETTGKMHPKSECFIDPLLTQMLTNTDPRTRSVLHFYWYARISCSLKKKHCRSIISKSRLINGSLTRVNNIKFIIF